MVNLQEIKKNKTIAELLEFGIINIDKSSGPTSFNVSYFLKKTLGSRKTSHFGTLDPKVTGVLPIALNRACKLAGYFLGEDKEYIGIMRIHEDKDMKEIQKVIDKKFLGEILQTPPVKSRVKRQERPRTIYKFELLEQDRKDIVFHTECQGGTYIRKLLDDLGIEMGIGAHMLELRRVRAGLFKEETVVNLYDFEKAVEEYKNGNEKRLREIIVPGEIVSELHEPIQIKEKGLKEILTGKAIIYSDLEEKQNLKKDQIISIFNKERFIGMYRVTNEEEVFARPEFVMQEISG